MASVLVSVEAGVQTLTLNRPEKLNAFIPEMHQELRRALEQAAAEREIRAVLLTGAGRGFCSGQDLSERNVAPGAAPIDLSVSLGSYYNPLVRRLRELPKPVVCAVNGVAAGAGVSLALACDLVYAAEEARFIQAFVRIGLVPDSGSTRTLVRALGRHRASQLMFSGEPLSAGEAQAAGLINAVLPAGELVAAVREAATRLASAPTRAIGLAKRSINAAEDASLDESLALEAQLQELAGRTDDHAEGVAAFAEKREPRFVGR